jgi:hypothetical protein
MYISLDNTVVSLDNACSPFWRVAARQIPNGEHFPNNSMTISKIASLCVLCALLSTAALAQTVTPQGRLTLTSNTPVMTSDVVGTSTVYYTPYQGALVPIYSVSTGWTEYSFSQLTLALDPTYFQANVGVYDVYALIHSGVVTIAAGSQWTNTTSRGTNAAADIQQLNGIWVNTYATSGGLYLNNGTTSYTGVHASEATYLGSIYLTASGQTSMMLKPAPASGGTTNIIGVFNAYNRVKATAVSRDNTATWTYGTATWRKANNSVGNSITWVDGLQQVFVRGTYNALVSYGANGNNFALGTNLDSSTAQPALYANTLEVSGAAENLTIAEPFYPQLGVHFLQAMEFSNTGTQTILGNGAMSLQWEGEI